MTERDKQKYLRYRIKNRITLRLKNRQYYKQNREKECERSRNYYQDHADERRQYARDFFRLHPKRNYYRTKLSRLHKSQSKGLASVLQNNGRGNAKCDKTAESVSGVD